MAKRILAPVTPSREYPSFLAALRDVAAGGGATVRLLHVAPAPMNVTDADGRVVAYADQEWDRLEREARDYLETIALALDGVAVEPAVRCGDPAREILREAEAVGADLIAMPTRGHRRLGRSVAEQVFRRADVPVALFRAGRAETAAR